MQSIDPKYLDPANGGSKPQSNSGFDDKEILTDALVSQKHITGTYNTFANECATKQMKSQFMNLLGEEHQIQMEMFEEMQKRGWYQVPPAPQDKINTAKQKFATEKSTM